jgi:hypothetical protein
MRDPVLSRDQPLWIEEVDAGLGYRLDRDQLGLPQHLEVLGHRRRRGATGRDQLAGAQASSRRQQLDDALPGGVAERMEDPHDPAFISETT